MSKRIVVVGGGLAGLAATIKIVEKGYNVDLISLVPVKRSHSVCAQGGINSAKDMKGEGDHPDIHTTDTLFGGEYLADQPLVQEMCYDGPGIIDLLDRMGVPFNRTSEGFLDFRRFGGTLHHRTAFAGATTGQQLLYALDEQVRRAEAEGKVEKHEYWEFMSIVKDGRGHCKGVVAMNVWDRSLRVFKANAVMLATGGPGLIFGKSTNSIINSGAAVARAFQQGVWYANGEFIQIHPTAIPGADKLRLISESVRGEGGRVWVPKKPGDKRAPTSIPDSERYYFLEEKFPKYGNLVPRDVATREIFDICVNQGMGVDGKNMVYLDITPEKCGQPGDILERKLGGVFEIYRRFAGADPLQEPMKIFPGMHYSMGGLWVSAIDEGDQVKQMTNVPGLFAIGECEFQYHGANRLGANSLLSCIFGGFIGGPRAVEWAESHSEEADQSVYDGELKRQEGVNDRILKMTNGTENPFKIHNELGDEMTKRATVVRENDELDKLREVIMSYEGRWDKLNLNDDSRSANQVFQQARTVWDMVQLAKPIANGALMRNECRGAHYKPEFDIPKPEKHQMGEPTDTDVYQEFVKELGKKNGVEFKVKPKSGKEVSPEFTEYMNKWVDREKNWNKTTLCEYREGGQPETFFRDVVMTVEPPKPRIYK